MKDMQNLVGLKTPIKLWTEQEMLEGSVNVIMFLKAIWDFVLSISGVSLAMLADWTLGGITITMFFGGPQQNIYGAPAWMIGFSLSAGTSAFQMLLQKGMKRHGLSWLDVLMFWTVNQK